MSLYKEQGIVLRTMPLGEADRIVTVLTQGEGKIRAVAKGVRKTRSRFGARLEVFTHVDLLLYRGRELDIITQADIIATHRRVREVYERFTAAEVIGEAADKISEERERNPRLFLLVLGALRALDADVADADAIADTYLLRLASVAGFRPALDACAECGSGDARLFSVSQGGMICEKCRDGGAVIVGEGTVPYLHALLAEEPVAAMPSKVRIEGGNLVRAYLEYHLNRPLRSWTHLERT